MTDNSVFEYVDKLGETKTFRVLGYNLLVRRCERNINEFLVGTTDKPLSKDARLMIDSMTKQGWCHWCHILAIGPDVYHPRTREQMERFVDRNRGPMTTDTKYVIPWGVECKHMLVGDYVVVPEVSVTNTQWRGVTGYEYDALTDITNIIAWLPETSNESRKRCG